MRRFRTTWLRKQRAPGDLITFWLGHSERSVTDSYSKLADDVEFRRRVAEKVGTGFEVSAYEAIATRPERPRKECSVMDERLPASRRDDGGTLQGVERRAHCL
jgi:hypothetical protein